MGKVHTKEKEEILSWNKNKIKQKSLELSGLFQPRWFYDCVMWQDFFKAAWFSINIFVLVRQVLGWIYKNLHIMRPLRLQENRNTSSSPKALTLIKEMEAEVLCAQFQQAETLPRKCFSALKPHQKKKKGRNIISSKLLHTEAQLTIKNWNYFFPSKNSQKLFTLPQATWEGEREESHKIKTVRILLFPMESASERTIL